MDRRIWDHPLMWGALWVIGWCGASVLMHWDQPGEGLARWILPALAGAVVGVTLRWWRQSHARNREQ